MPGKRWTAAEDETLIALRRDGAFLKECALTMGRTYDSIKRRVDRLIAAGEELRPVDIPEEPVSDAVRRFRELTGESRWARFIDSCERRMASDLPLLPLAFRRHAPMPEFLDCAGRSAEPPASLLLYSSGLSSPDFSAAFLDLPR